VGEGWRRAAGGSAPGSAPWPCRCCLCRRQPARQRRPAAFRHHLHRFRPGARRRPDLPAAIAADLGERQGQAGACFGVWNFVAKLNLALAAGLALPLLGFLGYAPGSAATAWAP
jgi:hypothetical protein